VRIGRRCALPHDGCGVYSAARAVGARFSGFDMISSVCARRAMSATIASALLFSVLLGSTVRAESVTTLDAKTAESSRKDGLARSPEGAPGGTTRVVRVGGREMIVPLSRGYLPMADLDPQIRGLIEDAVPSGMLLLDAMVHVETLNLQASEYGRHVSLELYTKQGLESVDLDANSWAQAKPMIAGALRRIDLGEKLEQRDDRLNEAFSARFGDEVRFEQGKPGEQVVYKEDARSIRMYLVLPMQQTLAGETYQVEEVRLVALTRTRSRMIGIGASLEFAAGKVDIAEAVKQFDAFVDACLELNPAS
jgi:hypothetical protein